MRATEFTAGLLVFFFFCENLSRDIGGPRYGNLVHMRTSAALGRISFRHVSPALDSSVIIIQVASDGSTGWNCLLL